MRAVRGLLTLLLITNATLSQSQEKPVTPRVTALAGKPSKAISGSRFLFLGEELTLSDLTCPPIDTDKGRDAKALLNTFLRRAGYFKCEIWHAPEGHTGTCTVSKRKGLAGKDVAKGMVASRLCYHTSSPLL